MTNRERALNLLRYKPVDRLPAVHFGYWSELLHEWADQGKISKSLADSWGDGNDADSELDKIIGWDFNWYRTVGANNGLKPSFESTVLQTFPDGTQRVINGNGLIEKVKPGITSIPHYTRIKCSKARWDLITNSRVFSTFWMSTRK